MCVLVIGDVIEIFLCLKHVLLFGNIRDLYICRYVREGSYFLKVWFSYVFIICYCTSKEFLSKFKGSSTLTKNSEMRTEFVKTNMCLCFLLWYARNSPIGASGFVMPEILFYLICISLIMF